MLSAHGASEHTRLREIAQSSSIYSYSLVRYNRPMMTATQSNETTRALLFWELAHINNDLKQALKTHATTRCFWMENRIRQLRAERDDLMNRLGL